MVKYAAYDSLLPLHRIADKGHGDGWPTDDYEDTPYTPNKYNVLCYNLPNNDWRYGNEDWRNLVKMLLSETADDHPAPVRAIGSIEDLLKDAPSVTLYLNPMYDIVQMQHIRCMVKAGEVNPELISFFYGVWTKDGFEIHEPTIDEDGRWDYIPLGFFDIFSKQMSYLLTSKDKLK